MSHPHAESPLRPDRRRGARMAGGVRVAEGVALRPSGSHGWADWMPEARERALRAALAAYIGAGHGVSLAEAERRHGVPCEYLAGRLAYGHPALLALPHTVRMARAALEIRHHACRPERASRRWGVDHARAAMEAAALANPLTLTRTLRTATTPPSCRLNPET